MNQSSELERWMDNKFFERNYNRFSSYDSLKNGKVDDTMLSTKTIIKQNANEYIFIHEYAYDGTLRHYLKQNFKKINWNDKLNIAKQLVSAVKCLHENDIVHMNLNEPSNKIKYIQHIDPQHLQNLETYKLNKSSDIYSIGVLLWEISSGVIPFIPFKFNLSLHYNLLNVLFVQA
ncbi:35751_t:CDS:2 [Gigaspora margarita]|uniref:35751_t:CDS:1 n=1 Tax=Gigaspora margarita TaxID=4874 RepID=A0ABM8W0L3_GIGMA|nr:35751_t:CDS:2 [Gigaspora margarita]